MLNLNLRYKFSVFEAAKKLNEVKGFKGLDRYFKQIAQSARAHLDENSSHVDDFLGSINIRLNELPSSGIDKWFELEGRSEKSNVEGQIRLRLKLATREDRGNSQEEDNWNDLKQREELLTIFIDYELSNFDEKKSLDWCGKLSRESETILHQHAIQGNITDFQIAIW
jgi:BAI1-associated protein 3